MEPTAYIDLHCHSYCSDGTFSPEGLVLLGKQQGLSALALTDHDTIDGIASFHAAGKTHGLETITGVELAAAWEKRHAPEIHIVGLGFDHTAKPILQLMEQLRQSREQRNLQMVKKLTEIGLPLTLEELAEAAGGEILTRAHFANVLLKKGYVHTREEAFQRFLSQGKAGFVPREFLTPKACICAIKKSGGAAVLAHPTLYGLAYDQIGTLCEDLQAYGLDGVECYYPTYTPNQRKSMIKLASYHKLLPSGGSDFHGANKPDIHLGEGRGNVHIPYGVWEKLKERTQTKET